MWVWRSTIRAQALRLGLLPLAFLIVVLMTVAVLQWRSEAASGWVRQSDDVLVRSRDLNAALFAVQRDAREYTLHRKAAQIRALQRDAARANDIALDMRRLVGRDPGQERRATVIANLANRIVSIDERFVRYYASGQMSQARAFAASPEIARISDAWQAANDRFARIEIALRNERWQRLQRESRLLDWVLFAGSLLGIVVTLLAASRFGSVIV
ncbi:MAG TPA: CHASE3 domain-containing protein, partial [Candidatus Baltobacteraceae bacterium]|nr:CHASE3 domain-containing protein [Candidatus Baltobacteraceae bacterium]